MSLLRKLTTKPLWWWERHRPYPIRKRWRDLPAVDSGHGPLLFVILVTPEAFADALWSGWSWMRFLKSHVRLCVYVDGEVTPEMRRATERLLPGATVIDSRSLLSQINWPSALAACAKDHPLGRKLALLLHVQRTQSVLFSDSDVIDFAPPTELIAAMQRGQAVFMEESHAGSFDPIVGERAAQLGIQPLSGFNSGLMFIPEGSLSVEQAESLLEGRPGAGHSWFAEQTILAVLMRSAGADPLPRDRYVISIDRQFYWEPDVGYNSIAARHFSGPTRHLMYLKAFPRLARDGGALASLPKK